MALDFPTYAPGTNIGQTYSPAGVSKSWTWNGYQWDAVGGGGATIPSNVTSTEIGYLDGVTSSIQTQLNGKVNDAGGTTNYIAKWIGSDTIGDTTALQNAEGDFVINGVTVGRGPGGINNTVIGKDAGTNATTNTNCTYIGSGVGGTAGENNVVRIGNSSTTAHYSYGDLLSWQGAGFHGTVSNTGFGAIMEYGWNANGEFVKFANGVQVCWRHWDDNVNYYSDWVFPSGFSAVPAGIFVTLDTAGAKFGTVEETTTFPDQTRIFRWDHDGTQNETTVSIRAMAIGRWFN